MFFRDGGQGSNLRGMILVILVTTFLAPKAVKMGIFGFDCRILGRGVCFNMNNVF